MRAFKIDLFLLSTFWTLFSPVYLYSQNVFISGVINKYTPVTSFGCDSSQLYVLSPKDFSVKDKILIIQMQGAQVDTSNSILFGSIDNLGSAGHFEINQIESIVGNKIGLKFSLFFPYDISGKVQLIKIPEYTNAIVNGLTCQNWDGSTGGVLVFEVKNIGPSSVHSLVELYKKYNIPFTFASFIKMNEDGSIDKYISEIFGK